GQVILPSRKRKRRPRGRRLRFRLGNHVAASALFFLSRRPYTRDRSTLTRRLPMSSPAQGHITSVLKETRTFPPPAEFAANAHIGSLAEYEKLWKRAKDDPEGFWAEQADSLAWFKRWDKVLTWNEPFARWFDGGRINA